MRPTPPRSSACSTQASSISNDDSIPDSEGEYSIVERQFSMSAETQKGRCLKKLLSTSRWSQLNTEYQQTKCKNLAAYLTKNIRKACLDFDEHVDAEHIKHAELIVLDRLEHLTEKICRALAYPLAGQAIDGILRSEEEEALSATSTDATSQTAAELVSASCGIDLLACFEREDSTLSKQWGEEPDVPQDNGYSSSSSDGGHDYQSHDEANDEGRAESAVEAATSIVESPADDTNMLDVDGVSPKCDEDALELDDWGHGVGEEAMSLPVDDLAFRTDAESAGEVDARCDDLMLK